jgi:hypothetical protein
MMHFTIGSNEWKIRIVPGRVYEGKKPYQAFLRREPSAIRAENVNLAVLFQPNHERDIRITLLAEFKRLRNKVSRRRLCCWYFAFGLLDWR